jgi:cytochrome P450
MSTATLDGELTSASFYDDPYPAYRRLRESEPVHFCAPWDQWVVTAHAEVMTVLRDPAVFSSSGWEQGFIAKLAEPERRRLAHLSAHYETATISNSDPPVHTRLRRLVSRSFTPRVVESLRPAVVDLVDERIGGLNGRSEFDLVSELAYPVPALVIADLLGAPPQARRQLEGWSQAVVAFVSTGSPETGRAERADAAFAGFSGFLEPLLAARRAEPAGDLLSLLVADGDEGEEALSTRELVAFCVTLVFAGHETTANLIGNGTRALLAEPDQLALLRSRPDLARAAAEELLRFDCPVQRVRRVVLEEVELGGRVLRPGERVMAFLGAANRDPAVFADPDVLDIERRPGGHVCFGHGIHFCLGASLTLLEAPIVFNGLLASFPELRLAEGAPPSFKANITFRGLESLRLAGNGARGGQHR